MKQYSLIIAFLLIGVVLYAQEPVNTLNKVNIKSDAYGIDIIFDFNGPVSFTSMKLQEPSRIVLDFTDCKKSGSVKNSIKVDSDGIKEISLSQMGSNDAPILRATILTTIDLEFNIEPTDNGINVKIAGVKLASGQQAETPKEEPQNLAEVTPPKKEEPKPEPQPAPVVAEAKPEPKPEPQPAPVVAEAKPEPKPEPQTAPVVAEAKPEPKPEPQPAPVVAEAKPEPKPEPQPAPVVAEAKPEPKPEPQPAPVVAEAKPEPKPEPQPAPVVEKNTEYVAGSMEGQSAPVVTEAKPTPTKEEKKPKFKPAPAKVASNEDIQKRKEEPQHIDTPRKKSSSGRNALTWLGFQMSATGSRVFIKTADEAEYSIKEKDDKTLVLEIYNTDIPKKNNRRPLDTSFFNSPVAYISPQLESGPMKVVKIEIKLKQRVPFITKQEANALYVDFEGAK